MKYYVRCQVKKPTLDQSFFLKAPSAFVWITFAAYANDFRESRQNHFRKCACLGQLKK